MQARRRPTVTEVLTREDVGAVLPEGDEIEVVQARVGRFDYKWVALAVVLCGTIITILDATIVNIAIPTLQVDLKATSYNDIAWVVTGYMLAQGAVIPMTGWATDRFGTKRLYLITITLFTLASMACGLAQNLRSDRLHAGAGRRNSHDGLGHGPFRHQAPVPHHHHPVHAGIDGVRARPEPPI